MPLTNRSPDANIRVAATALKHAFFPDAVLKIRDILPSAQRSARGLAEGSCRGGGWLAPLTRPLTDVRAGKGT